MPNFGNKPEFIFNKLATMTFEGAMSGRKFINPVTADTLDYLSFQQPASRAFIEAAAKRVGRSPEFVSKYIKRRWREADRKRVSDLAKKGIMAERYSGIVGAGTYFKNKLGNPAVAVNYEVFKKMPKIDKRELLFHLFENIILID